MSNRTYVLYCSVCVTLDDCSEDIEGLSMCIQRQFAEATGYELNLEDYMEITNANHDCL